MCLSSLCVVVPDGHITTVRPLLLCYYRTTRYYGTALYGHTTTVRPYVLLPTTTGSVGSWAGRGRGGWALRLFSRGAGTAATAWQAFRYSCALTCLCPSTCHMHAPTLGQICMRGCGHTLGSSCYQFTRRPAAG